MGMEKMDFINKCEAGAPKIFGITDNLKLFVPQYALLKLKSNSMHFVFNSEMNIEHTRPSRPVHSTWHTKRCRFAFNVCGWPKLISVNYITNAIKIKPWLIFCR